MSIPFNDSLDIRAPKSADNRYLSNGLIPYTTVSAALTAVPAEYRHRGLTLLVLKGGVPVEYWFQSGTANNNLVEKASSSAPGGSGGIYEGNLDLL